MTVVPRITRDDSPGLPPPFLHTGSDQNLEVWKAWERGYDYDLMTTVH